MDRRTLEKRHDQMREELDLHRWRCRTTTKLAVNGVATFTGLSVNPAGTYTLSATDRGLTAASSGSFTIAVGVPPQLALVQQPTTTVAGQTISPVEVVVEYAGGNVVPSDNSSITVLADEALGGTLTVSAVNGAATFGDLSMTLAGSHELSFTAVGGLVTFSNLTITKPGSHALRAIDGNPTSASSSSFPVTAAPTTLSVTAPVTSVTVGQTLQFTASGLDGAGAPITLDPVTWSLDAGSVGSIDQNGLFNAGSISISGGTATVIANCDGQAATMTITVNAIPPVITVNAYAQMVSSSSNTGTLHVEGQQNGTDANLTYTWSIISQPTVDSSNLSVGAAAGSPAPLALSAINGTNSAKNTPVTFLASGHHVLQVVASNGSQSVTSQVQVTARVNPKVTPAAVAQSTTVSGVQPISTRQSITGFVVTFNVPVDAGTAQNVSGYRILRPYTVNTGRSFWQKLFGQSAETQTEYATYKITSAVYDPQTYSVTLTLASAMPLQNGTRLVEVLGTGKHAVLGANGKAIDGDSNGKPGGTFIYRFSMSVAKTVTYKTTQGDVVKLSLSGPGRIVAIMPSNTATPMVNLVDTNSTDSILTGSIRKSKKSLGYVVVDEINGASDADIQLGDEFHVNQSNA